ncbi:MAG: methyltransferase domain-containing protein [Ferruginibacter sp.]
MICPVCDSSDNKLLYVINSEDSVKHLMNKSNAVFTSLQDHIKTLWRGDESSIFECNNCGLVYASPFISGDAVYYNMAYSDTFIYPKWKWEFEKTKKELQKLTTNNLMLLEIGAGTGEFVREISGKNIPIKNIHCTEFSYYGLAEIEKLGIKCFSLDIRDKEFQAKNNHYDIICMFQILEHLDNLHDFFGKLNLLANKNALLFIGVPNNIQRNFYDTVGIKQDVSPMHLTRWNYKSMSFIASKFGWSIISHEKEPQGYFENIEQFVRMYYEKKMKISEKLELKRNKFIRKFMKLSIFIYIFLRNIRVYPELFSKNIGTVQWFHLKKN